MQLLQADVGKTLFIRTIADPQAATAAIRLGISSGETVVLAAKVPGGPLVLQRGNVEIALGRDICKHIEVDAE
ncbi:MAG: ferrous iron transport protein A [Vampirovibrio sp.]|nr:ferrous iron transport protein A [Vampirovibrio sp.]